MRALPGERLLYFGDTAHLPYGDKSPDVLKGYVQNITRFLLSRQVKAIVIACNTASAVAADAVFELTGSLPVVEVINPTVEAAVKHSPRQRIGVIGTLTTIQSRVYRNRILQLSPDAQVVEKATPLLVPIVEEGWLDHPLCPMAIDAYLADERFQDIDALILGCTHYPLLRRHFEDYFRHKSETVSIIDSSAPTVARLAQILESADLLAQMSGTPPKHEFYVSDDNANFRHTATRFLGMPLSLQKLEL